MASGFGGLPAGVAVFEHRLGRSGRDAVVLEVGVQCRRAAGAQVSGGVGFPGVGEPPQRGQHDGAAAFGEQVERAAGVDRGQLCVVPDEKHLGFGGACLGGECVQGERPGEGGLVDDEELAGVQRPVGVGAAQGGKLGVDRSGQGRVGVGVEAGTLGPQGGGAFGTAGVAGAGGLVQPLGGVLARDAQGVGQLGGCCGRGGQADDRPVTVGRGPCLGQGEQGGGLAGASRADQDVDPVARGGDGAHRTGLVVRQVHVGPTVRPSDRLLEHRGDRGRAGDGSVDVVQGGQKPGLGVQDPVVGVPLLADAGEHRGPVGSQVLGGHREHLGRGQADAAVQGGGDHAGVQCVPVGRCGHPQAAGGAGGLGEQVRAGPGRAAGQHLVEHDAAQPFHNAVGHLGGRQGARVGGVHRGADQLLGGAAGGLGAASLPGAQQVAEGSDVLVRSGRAGHPLTQADDFDPVRATPVGGDELGDRRGHCGVDLRRAGGEQGEQRVGDTRELERGGAARAAGAPPPRDGQTPAELVGEQVVVDLRDRDDGVVQRSGIDRAPQPVGALDLVRQDQVGVQVRVAGAGVPVVERRCDRPPGGDLRARVGSGSGEQRGLGQQGEGLFDGGAVPGQDGGAGGVVGQRPQDRC